MTVTAPTQACNLTRIADLTPESLVRVLDLARVMKDPSTPLDDALRDRAIALIFEAPSTPTHVSFAAAAARLGATPIAVAPQEFQFSRGASIADTARSLSGYVDAIVIGAFDQATVDELARWATVPVVNALSDEHHPCQALADLLTIQEEFGDLEARKLGFVGDGGDNVAHSLLEAGALAGLDVTIACPPGSSPDQDVLGTARRLAAATGARLEVTHDSRVAVAGADVVYADGWASLGDQRENRTQRCALGSYEVTEDLMRLARPTAIFLHSLPARRGEEVAAEVIDGPQSAVWRQSANRLPTEEAVLLLLAHGGAR